MPEKTPHLLEREFVSGGRELAGLRLRRHYRFVFETCLLQSFLFLIYIWFVYSFGDWRFRFSPGEYGTFVAFYLYIARYEGPSLALLWAISTLFLIFVYYGTSFEATPLRLVLRPFR
jgi:hypothetical protein